ncbi:MAG TPA: FG-GAP-like repeat-containing protein, partial [Candidatus Dormibacteraeota bacterium]|nr:FG-GAP-like repeat-containing protein [Candidatus Dormibacteraeota bacterium]
MKTYLKLQTPDFKLQGNIKLQAQQRSVSWNLRLGPLLAAIIAVVGAMAGQAANVCNVPAPPSGHQAKITSVIDLQANRALEPIRTGVSDGGSGYRPNTNIAVLMFSSVGAGAQFAAYVGPQGNVIYVSSLDSHTNIHNGSGYADDLAMVIPPPHTNDFGSSLSNSTCTTLQLQSGTYYQNAVIDHDITIIGQGIGKTYVSGGLLDSVFKILPRHTVHLQDLTIIDGLAVNGGGIYNDGSTVTLDRVEIMNCKAYGAAGEGGGIYNKGAAVLALNDCYIHDNAAARDGGGISNSGINTSFLPVAATSTEHAADTLEQVFTGFIGVPAATNLDPNIPPSDDSYDNVQTQVTTFLGNVVHTIGDIPTLFNTFVGQTFDASGWSGVGAPTTRVIRSRIVGNKTGIGVASSDTLLIISTPIIDGYFYTPYGIPIPNIVGFDNTEFHPKDLRFGGWGGGIHNDLGLLVVQDSSVNHNEVDTRLASFGGGISSFLGALFVTNTPITANLSRATTVLPSGGAIFSFASYVKITDCQLNSNTVSAGLFMSSGGAIKNTGLSFTELNRCDLNNNASGGGGGLANDYLARASLTACNIRSNSTSGIIGAEGGGVRNGEGGVLSLDSCTLSGNTASGKAKGGGLFNHCEQIRIGPDEFPIIPVGFTLAKLLNCTISGNSLRGVGLAGIPLEARGAGIYNGSFNLGVASVELYSSTICSNTATGGLVHSGGGLWNTSVSSFKLKPSENIPGIAFYKVANDLFVTNVPNDIDQSSIPGICFIDSSGYNMDSDGTGRSQSTGFTTRTNFLAPLGFYGGRTPTHALLPGSPAIDNGSPDGALNVTNAPAKDQRGLARSLGGRRDVGAFENTPPVCFPETFVTFEDQPLTVPAAQGLLANDFGTFLRITPLNFNGHGNGHISADGSLTFTPSANFNGSFDVPYSASDAFGHTGGSTFTIVVRPRLDLLSMFPSFNSTSNGATANIVLNFDEDVNTNSAGNILLSGSLSGAIPFIASANGHAMTLDPIRSLQPGEVVSVTLKTNLQSAAGSPVFPAVTRQFAVEGTNGEAIFTQVQDLGPAGGLSRDYLGKDQMLLVDIDHDGHPDIVSTELGNTVWRNDGHGHFIPTGQVLSCPGGLNRASGIAVGDVDGDGLPDVFLVTDNLLAENCVWLNNGDGSFRRNPNTIVMKLLYDSFNRPAPSPTSCVALGDVNGDGFPDAILGGTGFYPEVQVWLNDGHGNFSKSDAVYNYGATAIALADLNGDGFLDIVVTEDSTFQSVFQPVRVLLNDGTGHFNDTAQHFTMNDATGVVLGDLNGDGKVDAVILGGDSLFGGTIPSIWLNDGTGHFTPGQHLPSGYFIGAVLADFNSDGVLDLALASQTGDNQIWSNDGHGAFTQVGSLGRQSAGISAGDVNGDGSIDIVLSGSADNQVFRNARRPNTGTPPSFSMMENDILRYALPSNLLATASTPNGGSLIVETNTTIEFRGTLGMIWINFGFVDPPYDGVWPAGSYVWRYQTNVMAAHGALSLLPNGTFVYRPDSNYFGPDSFTYRVTDGFAESLPATVNINVQRVPDPAVATNDWYTGISSPRWHLNQAQGAWSLDVAAPGVISNDIEISNRPLAAILDSSPANGSLTLHA